MGEGVTIHDVAAAAHVSISTVSKVANGRYDGSPSTAARVRLAIAELGYGADGPGPPARALPSVGLVTDDADPYSVEVARGATAVLREGGADLLAYFAPANDAKGWERTGVNQIASARAAGVILCLGNEVPPSPIPIVAVAHRLADPPVPSVEADDFGGMRSATSHVLELGHRRIAHLRGRTGHRAAELRTAGHRDALKAAGIEPDPALERDGLWDHDVARTATRELLQMPDRPTAIVANNDDSALAALVEAFELGLRVPHDLSIVGFDDMPAARLSDPALTTVAQPMRRIGEEAVRVLLDLIADRPARRRTVVETTLAVRGSTGRAPS